MLLSHLTKTTPKTKSNDVFFFTPQMLVMLIGFYVENEN